MVWAKFGLASLCLLGLLACDRAVLQSPADSATPAPTQTTAQASSRTQSTCRLVEKGFGALGTVNIRAEEVVSGLEVPWGIAFLPNNDMLVTERPGRVRLVRQGQLQPQPVARLSVTARGGEGGLLGIALHPQFVSNRLFYLYHTTDQGGRFRQSS